MTLELTEDKAEGHRAWRERRKPQFKGADEGLTATSIKV